MSLCAIDFSEYWCCKRTILKKFVFISRFKTDACVSARCAVFIQDVGARMQIIVDERLSLAG